MNALFKARVDQQLRGLSARPLTGIFHHAGAAGRGPLYTDPPDREARFKRPGEESVYLAAEDVQTALELTMLDGLELESVVVRRVADIEVTAGVLDVTGELREAVMAEDPTATRRVMDVARCRGDVAGVLCPFPVQSDGAERPPILVLLPWALKRPYVDVLDHYVLEAERVLALEPAPL